MLRVLNRFDNNFPQMPEMPQQPQWNNELDFAPAQTITIPKKRLLRAGGEDTAVADTHSTESTPNRFQPVQTEPTDVDRAAMSNDPPQQQEELSKAEQNAIRIAPEANKLLAISEDSKNGQITPMDTVFPPTYGKPNPTYNITDIPDVSANPIDRGSDNGPINNPYAQKAPLSETQQIMADIQDYKSQPQMRQPSFFRRLGSGIKNGLMSWVQNGAEGGLGGLIGAIGSGGLISAFSPNADKEMRQEAGLRKMFQKYQQARALETAQNEQSQEFAKTQKGMQDFANSVLTGQKSQQDLYRGNIQIADDAEQLKQRRAKPLLDTALAKGYLTPKEISRFRDEYGIDVTDPNNRRFEGFWADDGNYYMHQVNSPEFFVNTSLPKSPSRMVRPATFDGDTFNVTDPQALNAKVTATQGNIRNEIARQNREEDRANKVADNEQKFNQDKQENIIKAKARYDKAAARRNELISARATAEQNGQDTASIDKDIADAAGEMNAAAAEEQNWKKQQYQSSSSQGNGKQMNRSEAKSYLKRLHPDWSDNDIETALNSMNSGKKGKK